MSKLNTKSEIIEYLKNKNFFCANLEEAKILIKFFSKKRVPMNPIIPKRILEDNNLCWNVYFITDFQLEAHGDWGNYMEYNDYSKVFGLQKLKQPKWKKYWREI